jgi:hypothetical protein
MSTDTTPRLSLWMRKTPEHLAIVVSFIRLFLFYADSLRRCEEGMVYRSPPIHTAWVASDPVPVAKEVTDMLMKFVVVGRSGNPACIAHAIGDSLRIPQFHDKLQT